MSCDGFDHGSKVITQKPLTHKGLSIPAGAKGTVVKLDRHNHRIDVRFEGFGVVRDLPAHSFGPEQELVGAC